MMLCFDMLRYFQDLRGGIELDPHSVDTILSLVQFFVSPHKLN